MSEPSPTRRSFYVVGGTMPPDSPSYVERRADAELLRRLREREYCYVLTPRQMGKSSLMARTAKELRAQGIRTAIVDLTAIGGLKEHVTAAQWYYGFLHRLLREFRVEFDLERWWNGKENLPPLQRLTDFFDALLRLVEEPMAIFVDEIDTTIGLPFKDDFFAAIRAEHNARAFDPMRRRLTFALLGVASPAELIQDARRTPFNIGSSVELTDFTRSEALVLVQGLAHESGREAILDRVLYWTSGHPYLTQKLCRAVADEKCGDADYSGLVDRVAGRNFLGAQSVRTEENLKFVASRLKHDGGASKSLLRLLTVIRHGGAVTYEPASALHVALKLSGVVGLDANGKLAVRNRIYDYVFTANWAKTGRALAGAWARRSLRYAAAGQRDRALLCRLRALEFEPSDYHWAEAARLADGDFAVLRATLRHSGPVTTVAWSPDGSTILTASEDRTAQLWDASSGMPKGPALRHKGPVWVAAFSPRGNVVATVSDDSTGRLWAAESGIPVGPPLRHRKPAWVVQFSPSGDVLLTGSDDGAARLWDPETGEPACAELSHPDAVEAAAFSPDGTIIAIASANNELRLWNARDGSQLGAAVNFGTRVTVVAFSPDGRLLFTAGDDTSGTLWQVDASVSPPIRRVFIGERDGARMRAVVHAGSIRAAYFAKGGTSILTASEDRAAILWDCSSATKLAPSLHHEHWVRTVSITGAGDVCATGSEDRTACVWSLPSGAPLYQKLRHEGRVVDVRFSPDERMIATASHDGTARVWYVDRMKGAVRQAAARHEARITTVALSNDGQLIATGSEDCSGRIWAGDSALPKCKPLHHDGPVHVVAFAPDGETLLTGSQDGYVRLWGIAEGELKYLLNHEREIRAAAFSEDGGLMASGSADMTARIWKMGSEAPLVAVLRHQGTVEALEFSNDGKALVTVTDHNTARVWGVPSGDLLAVLSHEGPVRAVALTPDGRVVATGSEDKVRIWSAQTGNLLSATLPHGGDVNSLSFSPDGKILATGTAKGDLRLWSDFGAPLRKAIPHSEPIQSIFFTPDGKLTLCATESWLHVYKTSSGKAVISRPLPGVWAGAWRFLPGSAARLRAIVRWTPDTALAADIDLNETVGMPDDDPRDILEEYGSRCGLRIDERDRIVPRWISKANVRRNLLTRNEVTGSS